MARQVGKVKTLKLFNFALNVISFHIPSFLVCVVSLLWTG